MIKLPKKLKVRVNKTNIRRGVKSESDRCAITKAIQRTIQAKRSGWDVEVAGGTEIHLCHKNQPYNSVTYAGVSEKEQKRIDDFIKNFDDKKSKVKPCTFRLRLEKDIC